MLPATPVLGTHVRKSLELAAARPAFSLGLRAATATIPPLVVAEATGHRLFTWMALGAWLCAIVDPGGAHLLRARSMAAFAAAGAIVTAFGTVASGSPLLAIALLFATSIGASLARVGGVAAGAVGTVSLILACLVLGSPASADQVIPRLTMVLAGCALSIFLALVLWPVHAYRPARTAVGACYGELAAFARGIAQLSGDPERGWSTLLVQRPPQIRAQLEMARVALGTVRRGRLGASARGQQLVVLFETADILLGALIMGGEALTMRSGADTSWLRKAADTLQGIAKAVDQGADPPAMPMVDAAVGGPTRTHDELDQARTHVLNTLQVAVRVAAALHAGAPSDDDLGPSDAEVPRTTVRATLAPDSAILRHAIRMAVAVSIAAAVAAQLGVVKASWITFTVVLVLQPDSGSTLRRAVQRVLGTIVGAGAAALLLPLLRSPTVIGIVLFPLSALGLALRPLNYGLFTMLITPVFLLMAELTTPDRHLARARVVNTLIGGAIALAAQLFWPSRERDQLPQRLATLFERLRSYLDQVLADARSEARARRSFGLAAANADSSFQRHLGEVLEPPERVSDYSTLLTYARRFRNGIVMAVHSPEADALRAARPALDAALEDLAAAVRDQRPPAPLPHRPGSGPAMTRIARQLQVLHSAVERLAPSDSTSKRH